MISKSRNRIWAAASVIFLVVVVGGLLVFWGAWRLAGDLGAEQVVTQPIEFPHKTHLKLALACTACHQRVERDTVAGRPPTTLCLACHSAGDTDSPEVQKLRAFGEKGEEIPWRRVWRLPSHVFFSHRTHVAVAKVNCQTCHGPMETLIRPPAGPLRRLTMNDCMDCHEKWRWRHAANEAETVKVAAQQISNDCLACHR